MAITTLPTLDGEIDFDEAIQSERNMLHRLTYWQKRSDFHLYLHQHRTNIEALIASHLGLERGNCQLTQSENWIYGSFNACLPVNVSRWNNRDKRVIIRFPLPYKIGELEHPGNADEKLRCEAATYIWIEENCPEVPIPRLWGFGFADGHSFTAPEVMPFHQRWIKSFQRCLWSLFGYPVPCKYICCRRSSSLKLGYLLMDYIEKEEGVKLSETWEELRDDKTRRNTLFQGLSNIMLSLGRIPLPRIGSFTINNEGVISLTNRPLTLQLQEMENEGIPTNISRDLTYTAIEPYLLDKIALYDSRLRYQPNAIKNEGDCRAQMTVLTGIRSVFHHFYDRNLRLGPFLLTLTDLDPCNLFVDADWHIKYVIDLEWACVLPIELQHPPHWLSNLALDELDRRQVAAFDEIRKEFMDAFETEEKLYSTQHAPLLRTQTMNSGWDTSKFFYFNALDSSVASVAIFALYWWHIQPKFARSHLLDDAFDRIFSPFWEPEAAKFVSSKLEERDEYDKQLRRVFEMNIDRSNEKV